MGKLGDEDLKPVDSTIILTTMKIQVFQINATPKRVEKLFHPTLETTIQKVQVFKGNEVKGCCFSGYVSKFESGEGLTERELRKLPNDTFSEDAKNLNACE